MINVKHQKQTHVNERISLVWAVLKWSTTITNTLEVGRHSDTVPSEDEKASVIEEGTQDIKVTDYFDHWFCLERKSTFAISSSSNVRICCFSVLSTSVNWISSGFGLLVGPTEICEDVTLVFKKHWTDDTTFSHSQFILLPSGETHRSICCRVTRLQSSIETPAASTTTHNTT